MRRKINLVLFITLIIVAAGCGKEVNIEEPAEVIGEYTTLNMTSNPCGATIYVNGKNSGYKTPCQIPWIEQGNLKVTFKLDLYMDSSFNISAFTSKSAYYYDFFSDNRNFGSAEFTSYPRGADIYINGSYLSKKTPYYTTSLRPGKYRIKFKYPEHRTDSADVVMRAMHTIQVYKRLVDTSTFVDYTRETNAYQSDCLLIDKQNRILCGTSGGEAKGIIIYEKNKFINYDLFNSPLPGNYVNFIFVDSKQNTWISSNGGLSKLSASGNWEVFTPENSPLPVRIINSICEDQYNNIWIGTMCGLLRYKDGNWDLCKDENSTMPTNNITYVARSQDNSIWVTNYYYGISRYYNGKWEYFTPQNSQIPGPCIFRICSGSDNTVYALDSTGVSKYYNGMWTKLYKGPAVRAVFEDCNKNVWISDGGTVRILKNDGTRQIVDFQDYSRIEVKSIQQDKDKNIWFATYNFGLLKYKYYK